MLPEAASACTDLYFDHKPPLTRGLKFDHKLAPESTTLDVGLGCGGWIGTVIVEVLVGIGGGLNSGTGGKRFGRCACDLGGFCGGCVGGPGEMDGPALTFLSGAFFVGGGVEGSLVLPNCGNLRVSDRPPVASETLSLVIGSHLYLFCLEPMLTEGSRLTLSVSSSSSAP